MAWRTIKTSCDSHKVAYASALDAGKAADWAAARGLTGRWPYLCRWCDRWHLTSQEPTG
jgi:hypothetical protein